VTEQWLQRETILDLTDDPCRSKPADIGSWPVIYEAASLERLPFTWNYSDRLFALAAQRLSALPANWFILAHCGTSAFDFNDIPQIDLPFKVKNFLLGRQNAAFWRLDGFRQG